MILVAQIIASHKFLVSMGFNNIPLFIGFWAVVIIYTAQGGLKAVISTDMVQAGFFSVVFFTCFAFVFFYEPAASTLPLPQLGDFDAVSPKLCGWLLMPLLFMVIEQDMGQRCFAGASPQVVSKAALLAGIGTLLVCVVPVFFGSLAHTMGVEIPKGGSVLMTAVAMTTSPWLTALVGCAVLAAVISTATSLINAISSNVSNDFKLPAFQKIGSVRMVQGVTGVISIAAIFFAFYFDNIVDLLIQSYELSISCLFAPLIIGLFKRNGHFLSALFAILFGALGFVFFRLYPIGLPKEVASVLLSFAGFTCGELVANYQKKILVSKESSL